MHKTISQAAELLWTNDFFISPDDSIKPHRHPYFYHMFFLSKGNRTISLSGNDYNINEGQAVLASPDTEHGICCSDSSEDSQFIEIKFIVYSNTLNAALKDLPPVWNLDITAQNMMKEIIAMSQKTSGYSKTNIIRYFLGTLLYYICKDVLEKKNEPSLPSCLEGFDTKGFSNATILTAEYIEKNYMENLSLTTIGESIGYYKNYISTVVKKDIGITVNDLITFVRIRKAAELLYYSDYSIKNICILTGFKNVNHFTRQFKNMVGIPPAHYRRSFPEFANENDTSTPVWSDKKIFDFVNENIR